MFNVKERELGKASKTAQVSFPERTVNNILLADIHQYFVLALQELLALQGTRLHQ